MGDEQELFQFLRAPSELPSSQRFEELTRLLSTPLENHRPDLWTKAHQAHKARDLEAFAERVRKVGQQL